MFSILLRGLGGCGRHTPVGSESVGVMSLFEEEDDGSSVCTGVGVGVSVQFRTRTVLGTNEGAEVWTFLPYETWTTTVGYWRVGETEGADDDVPSVQRSRLD